MVGLENFMCTLEKFWHSWKTYDTYVGKSYGISGKLMKRMSKRIYDSW